MSQRKLMEQMHFCFDQSSCLHHSRYTLVTATWSVFLQFKSIFFLFTRVTTVIVCRALSTSKTQVTYNQYSAFKYPVTDGPAAANMLLSLLSLACADTVRSHVDVQYVYNVRINPPSRIQAELA